MHFDAPVVVANTAVHGGAVHCLHTVTLHTHSGRNRHWSTVALLQATVLVLTSRVVVCDPNDYRINCCTKQANSENVNAMKINAWEK